MTKSDFKQIVEHGRDRGKLFMVVRIETEGNPGPEIIINPAENFDRKMAYYDKVYNDDMELIAAKKIGKQIRITDVLMADNLNDLNWFAY